MEKLNRINALITKNYKIFRKDGEPLTSIKGHELDVKLSCKTPYPPSFKRPPYPAKPNSKTQVHSYQEF